LLIAAKPEGGRNLEISQACIDATNDLYANSEALRDIINSIEEKVIFECRKGAYNKEPFSASCSMRYPQFLVDEMLDACEYEGGQPITMTDATISCDGKYQGGKVELAVSYQDVVECVASSCEDDSSSSDVDDFDDFEDFELKSIIALKRVLRRAPDGLHDVNCWVEEDEDDGLSGGAISGIVIGSVFGAALLLAIAYCLICRETDEEPKEETPETAVVAPHK
jgi:hypothetical protein